MRFLIDEQLPSLPVDVLVGRGYEETHVTTLSTNRRVFDSLIVQQSTDSGFVVVTKNVDFLNSYLIKGLPKKIIYVAAGTVKNRELLSLFRQHIVEITNQLNAHNVVEINKSGMHILH